MPDPRPTAEECALQRLIREADTLWRDCGDGSHWEALDEARAALSARYRGWRLLSEEQPQPNQRVLVYDGERQSIATWDRSMMSRTWHFFDDNDHEVEDVTHWQAMPAQPQPEEVK